MKYKVKKFNIKGEEEIEEIELADKDFLLITAIDNLTKELERGRINGR